MRYYHVALRRSQARTRALQQRRKMLWILRLYIYVHHIERLLIGKHQPFFSSQINLPSEGRIIPVLTSNRLPRTSHVVVSPWSFSVGQFPKSALSFVTPCDLQLWFNGTNGFLGHSGQRSTCCHRRNLSGIFFCFKYICNRSISDLASVHAEDWGGNRCKQLCG